MLVRNYAASLALVASAALASCGGGVASSSNDCAPVPIHCASGCRYGAVGSDAPTCVSGQWICPSPGPACLDGGSIVDASGDANADANDAHDDVVVFDAASVACGPSLVCTNTTQFCRESSGGPPPPPDAGSGIGYGCEPYPAACATNRTCACLRANGVCGGGLVSCQASGAGITVECAFP